MDLIMLIPVTMATLVAVVGWIVAHKLNADRDVRNKQREIRVKYLVEVYETLLELGRNVNILGNYRDVEKAVNYIQLFGNAKQVELCEKFVKEVTGAGKANHTDLAVEIRNSIREEIGLKIINSNLTLLKIIPKNEIGSQAVVVPTVVEKTPIDQNKISS